MEPFVATPNPKVVVVAVVVVVAAVVAVVVAALVVLIVLMTSKGGSPAKRPAPLGKPRVAWLATAEPGSKLYRLEAGTNIMSTGLKDSRYCAQHT